MLLLLCVLSRREEEISESTLVYYRCSIIVAVYDDINSNINILIVDGDR